jgi:hypothetical protein
MLRSILIYAFLLTTLWCRAQETYTWNQDVSIKVYELLDQLLESGLPIVYSKSNIGDRQIQIGKGSYTTEDLLAILEANEFQITRLRNSILVNNPQPQIDRRWTLSGYVLDESSGEALIGASISIDDSEYGTYTNNYGYFSLSLKPGQYIVNIQFVGFSSIKDTIDLYFNHSEKFQLEQVSTELTELIISSRTPDYNITSLIPGERNFNYGERNQIPYFLGEVDVFQKSLLTPGIRTIGDDASGLNVRGGDIDQNLVLLDEAVIYNPNHFYGLISVFNPEAVNRVRFMKGFIPPEYGGRASSIVTIHQREGNNQEYHVSGGIGLVSLRLMAEGPIVKGQSSFLVSGRQSIFDVSALEDINEGLVQQSNTRFQDLNAKINWRLNDKNTFYLSGYFGNDRNRAGFNAIRNWGNRTVTARWNHAFNPSLFSNYSFVFSDYVYRITNPVEAGSFIGKSNVRNYTAKLHHQYTVNSQSAWDFGANFTLHDLEPGERLPLEDGISSSNPVILDQEFGLEFASYLSHQWKITPKLSTWYGIRFTGLLNFGPDEAYEYDPAQSRSDDSIIDTIQYDRNAITDGFTGLEPRISLNYSISDHQSIKASYSTSNQYIHLISNTESPAPTDIWKLSDRYIPPISSRIASLGYYHNFSGNQWQTSAEIYWKVQDNIIEYKNGANLLFNENIETELLLGKGRAYGIEYLVEKTTGRLRGWLGYTWSRSLRRVQSRFRQENINDGQFYADNWDKPHDVSVVTLFDATDRWLLSMSFNYSTGRPTSFPRGKHLINGELVPYFEDRNQDRISDYHRLDLSAKWLLSETKKNGQPKKWKSSFTFTVFNVYARSNAYSYIFRQSEIDPLETEVIKYAVFESIVPSVTFNFTY